MRDDDKTVHSESGSQHLRAVVEDIARRRAAGESLTDEQVVAQHPQLMPELGEQLRALAAIAEQLQDGKPDSTSPPDADTAPHIAGQSPAAPPSRTPQFAPGDVIHRYVVERVLGEGHFGTVYLARDENLGRQVAVKVPRPERLAAESFVEQYLAEAHTVARLEHEGIVPIYDADRLDGTCFVVYKYFAGGDLNRLLREAPPAPDRAAELVTQLAEALSHVHQHKIVHRDLKPANIFIDEKTGRAVLGDFGLALTEEDFGKGPQSPGTLPYMSPEQVRGEGHLVDGRSDIFSLGAVFYELLTGERPFLGSSWQEIADRIKSLEVRPPRQLAPAIPQELQRICLKALSKRAVDRYATADDLADDLRHYASRELLGQSPPTDSQPVDTPRVEPHAIFISYRREDCDAFAGRLCDHLAGHFGPDAVFLDVASTPYGVDFPRHLDERIGQCRVVLVVIGPKWLGEGTIGNRRIDQPADYVRREVETALTRSPTVIPILVGGMSMPEPAALPVSIGKLAELNGCPVDTGADFPLHVERLVKDIRAALAATEPSKPPGTGLRRGLPPRSRPLAPGQSVQIVPKGLRSFDAGDADFFLELLPGPCDREGLPESIRFWKTRIEATDPDETFRVGLLYGPSGCGKSSLVKAGLLPRLAEHVTPIYVEATAADTETRLLKALHKHCPPLPEELTLVEALAELRRGRGLPAGKKILLVIDQFEQWLHAQQGHDDAELVQALRHCDGARVQCVVAVRDDFWLAVSRFMQALEIRIVEAENSRLVDVFDLRHARTVLSRFGEAFGALPAPPGQRTPAQEAFLERAIAGLAQEEKVICVRLALMADMLKGKAWTPATLERAGGTEGVGEAFLEETFSGATAPPAHKVHQKAARAVLTALLPESGSHIKGNMRSYDQLLAASGYADRPRDFGELISILDTELRLITPTDPAGHDAENSPAAQVEPGQRYYLLTHDYLVPSLRAWLTRKQRETRRGRAELRLAERAAQWNAKPENRHLPAWWEYLNIATLTPHKSWTAPQRRMMRQAGRVHGRRWGTALLVSLAVGLAVQQRISAERDKSMRQRVEGAVAAMSTTRGVPVARAIDDLGQLPPELVVTQLRKVYEDHQGSDRLSLAYALAHFGDVQVDYLVSQIEDVRGEEVDNLATALSRGGDAALDALRAAAAARHEREAWEFKARLAIVALRMGEPALAEDMLEFRDRPDPIQRTVFIETFANWHGSLQALAPQMADVEHPGLLSGICLAVGSVADVDQDAKSAWRPLLEKWHVTHPDAGTHSASKWALRQWELDVPPISGAPTHGAARGWSVTQQKHLTMIHIPGGSFERGSERGAKQVVEISPFLLSDCEITVELFRAFVSDPDYSGAKPNNWSGEDKQTSPGPAHPVQRVNWYEAAMFCNWLSEREELDPCYKISLANPSNDVEILNAANGFRLPTEAQWEYACRAGTTTRFSFGDNAAWLYRYGVYAGNSTSRTAEVGSRACSGWGLFDMHGNLWEWCNDSNGTVDEKSAAFVDPKGLPEGSDRVYRGGGWEDTARRCESALRLRYGMEPSFRFRLLGFRVARVPSGGQVQPAGGGAESGSREPR
jgi:formylglycine-generating enzyme required for sulfatase activity/predicted Ser/Thr protein kinase